MNNDQFQPLSSERQRMMRMLKALGNPVRLQIVEFLASRAVCITNDIVKSLPLAQSTVSQHLKVLRSSGLINGEVEGPATCYCLDRAAFDWLREQLAGWLTDESLYCCPPVIETDRTKEQETS